jgi:pimeloyl-ACP methyl ester carboxylesterase
MNGYSTFGHGDHKVLALHGWFGDERTFVPMQAALNPDRFTYVSMAYRGYGASKDFQGVYSLEEIALDALALADHLGWQRFSLLGHSMGGKAAQLVLAIAPDRVRKIAAVTPVPPQAVPFDDASWNLFDGAAANADNRYAIIDFSTGNRLSSTWINSICQHSLKTARQDAFASYLHAWAKTEFADRCNGKAVPIRVFVGSRDQSITEEVIRATFLPLYPNCEVTVVENAGHYPMEEAPISLATEIECFFEA